MVLNGIGLHLEVGGGVNWGKKDYVQSYLCSRREVAALTTVLK